MYLSLCVSLPLSAPNALSLSPCCLSSFSLASSPSLTDPPLSLTLLSLSLSFSLFLYTWSSLHCPRTTWPSPWLSPSPPPGSPASDSLPSASHTCPSLTPALTPSQLQDSPSPKSPSRLPSPALWPAGLQPKESQAPVSILRANVAEAQGLIQQVEGISLLRTEVLSGEKLSVPAPVWPALTGCSFTERGGGLEPIPRWPRAAQWALSRD